MTHSGRCATTTPVRRRVYCWGAGVEQAGLVVHGDAVADLEPGQRVPSSRARTSSIFAERPSGVILPSLMSVLAAVVIHRPVGREPREQPPAGGVLAPAAQTG